jgi:DNA-binding transcriptional ArsR family regulator
VTTDELRIASKDLLGNKYRLEIGAAIHERNDEPLTALAISDFTGVRYQRVQEDLKRLTAAGLLVQPDEQEGQTVEYQPVESVYWELCRALLLELADE